MAGTGWGLKVGGELIGQQLSCSGPGGGAGASPHLFFVCLQKVGFFNQQYADQLNMEETATEYLIRNFNLPYQDSRKCLGRFGLESHAHTIQISKLSGRSHQLLGRS